MESNLVTNTRHCHKEQQHLMNKNESQLKTRMEFGLQHYKEEDEAKYDDEDEDEDEDEDDFLYTVDAPHASKKRKLQLDTPPKAKSKKMEQAGRRSFMIHLELGDSNATFDLAKAVCNHGFFMLAPNTWIPSSKTLQRPIRLRNHSSYTISICQPPYTRFLLCVRVHQVTHLPAELQNEILEQVQRMLRISTRDERDIQAFHKMHPRANQTGFGRIIRSPSLFEDVVKCMLMWRCGWKKTIEMANALCALKLPARNCKRKKGVNEPLRNFPSPQQLAYLDPSTLKKHCNLGFRAKSVIEFARTVEEGEFDINELEELAMSADSSSYSEVKKKLEKIKGAGSFIVATLVMCLGFYHQVPIDSETRRHVQEVHGKVDDMKIEKRVSQIYDQYAPYQCLAYWLELTDGYEKALGSKLSELACSEYYRVAGNCSAKVELVGEGTEDGGRSQAKTKTKTKRRRAKKGKKKNKAY